MRYHKASQVRGLGKDIGLSQSGACNLADRSAIQPVRTHLYHGCIVVPILRIFAVLYSIRISECRTVCSGSEADGRDFGIEEP